MLEQAEVDDRLAQCDCFGSSPESSPKRSTRYLLPALEGCDDLIDPADDGGDVSVVDGSSVQLARQPSQRPPVLLGVLGVGCGKLTRVVLDHRYGPCLLNCAIDDLDRCSSRGGSATLLPCPLTTGLPAPFRHPPPRGYGDLRTAPPTRHRLAFIAPGSARGTLLDVFRHAPSPPSNRHQSDQRSPSILSSRR